jgi:hypothetical protein
MTVLPRTSSVLPDRKGSDSWFRVPRDSWPYFFLPHDSGSRATTYMVSIMKTVINNPRKKEHQPLFASTYSNFASSPVANTTEIYYVCWPMFVDICPPDEVLRQLDPMVCASC